MLVRKSFEIGDQIRLLSGRQHVVERQLLDIGNHRPVLTDDLQFIDAQDLRGLEMNRLAHALNVIVEDVADGSLIDAHLTPQLREGLRQAALFQIADEPRSGEALAVHVWQRGEQRLAAGRAAITATLNFDKNTSAVHRRVHEALRLFAMAVQPDVATGRAGCWLALPVGFHKIVIAVIVRLDGP